VTPVYRGVMGAESDAKTVSITDCVFVDVLVGEWTVTEKMLWLNDVYQNNHPVIVEKVDEGNIKIHNFIAGGLASCTITATVDKDARTITIPYQAIDMGDPQYDFALASFAEPFPGSNIGKVVAVLPVEGYGRAMKIVFPVREFDFRDTPLNGSWQTLAFIKGADIFDATNAGQGYLGQDIVGIDAVWNKR
jgi:hypothetical protein